MILETWNKISLNRSYQRNQHSADTGAQVYPVDQGDSHLPSASYAETLADRPTSPIGHCVCKKEGHTHHNLNPYNSPSEHSQKLVLVGLVT